MVFYPSIRHKTTTNSPEVDHKHQSSVCSPWESASITWTSVWVSYEFPPWYMPQVRYIFNIWNFYRCFSDEWMNPWVQLLPWVVCGTHVLSPLINLSYMSHPLSGTISSPARVLERGPLVGVWWEKLLSLLFICPSLCWKAFPLGSLS